MNQQKIGQFLKTLRSQKSVMQAELAEILGVPTEALCDCHDKRRDRYIKTASAE